jgi:hypothetical protein
MCGSSRKEKVFNLVGSAGSEREDATNGVVQ